MKRCDWCGSPFGLICHRHYGKRFCRKTCKKAHVQRRWQIQSARHLHWLQALRLAIPFTPRETLGTGHIHTLTRMKGTLRSLHGETDNGLQLDAIVPYREPVTTIVAALGSDIYEASVGSPPR